MRRLALLILWMTVVWGGCLFEEKKLDQYPCSAEHPQCPGGMECKGTVCVSGDGGAADSILLDQAGPVEDGAKSDAGKDAPAPDLLTTDGPMIQDLTTDALPDGGCISGKTQACYSGPAGTEGTGECKAGTQECTNGAWGACKNEVLPTVEICDNKDNDCNGNPDDLSRDCYTGAAGTEDVGQCHGGSQTCAGGSWGQCVGEVTPNPEVCDTLDNDCDGDTDEGCSCTDGATQSCGSDVGECEKGTQTCTGGSWGQCTGGVTPSAEICDNKDNNCDGNVDQFSEPCYTGPPGTEDVGECMGGFRSCAAGSWSSCNGQVIPTTEICDNKDNDCDGNVDQFSQYCYTGPGGSDGVGVCHGGTRTCTAGSWTGCIGEVVPTVELCDGVDTNCNGSLDDSLNPPLCANQNGVCAGATKPCGGTASWLPCSSNVYSAHATSQGNTYQSSESLCDGEDNDCDGNTDEGLTSTFYKDSDGDSFGDPDKPVQLCSLQAGYAANDDDCNDWDEDVFPGQTEYFPDPREKDPANADPTPFDYNCDGVEEKEGVIANVEDHCEYSVSPPCTLKPVKTIKWCFQHPKCGADGDTLATCGGGGVAPCTLGCTQPPCPICNQEQQACR